MIDHTVVIAGGEPMPADFLRSFVSATDYVIAVDLGATYALEAGITPNLVLGDLDSLGQEGIERLRTLQIPMESYPLEKNESDLELALRSAVTGGTRRISILCALGGRLDHLVTNLMCLLIPHESHVPCRIVGPNLEAFFLMKSATIAGRRGDLVTLVPISSRVKDVVTTGLRYALKGESLYRGTSRGLSNELNADVATLKASSGLLLVIVQTPASVEDTSWRDTFDVSL